MRDNLKSRLGVAEQGAQRRRGRTGVRVRLQNGHSFRLSMMNHHRNPSLITQKSSEVETGGPNSAASKTELYANRNVAVKFSVVLGGLGPALIVFGL